jgi:hypothetical protein
MATQKPRFIALWAFTLAGLPVATAQAQGTPPETTTPPVDAPPPAAPPAESTVPPAPADTAPADAAPAPAPAPVDAAPVKAEPPPTVFPPPQTRAPKARRAKPQQSTVGMEPAAADFGAEADIVSSVGAPKPPPLNRRWNYTLRGFFRAPARVGIGPETGSTDGMQLHSPPRMVGRTDSEWNYIGVAPAPIGQLQLKVENRRVSANVILAGDMFFDAGYPNLVELGGFSQAWVTLRWPDLIGTSGGLACNVGAFSERFGMAGPQQQSSGYYGTYLFGRTHVAGESCTLDVDLSANSELILEHGVGGKIEVVPYRKAGAPVAPYLPNQGPVPQGSTYLHHAHAAFLYKDWLRLAGHYLYTWTPDDLVDAKLMPARTGKMTIVGGEVHTDHPVAGSGYVGYSYIDAKRILPLSDAVQVIHGGTGAVFKENYFGKLPQETATALLTKNDWPGRDDSGTVQTVLAQYILRARPLFGKTDQGVDVTLAVFGMLTHIEATKSELMGRLFLPGTSQPVPTYELKQDRYKFGGELQFSPINTISLGARFDRVMPDGQNADVAYSAISPRFILHTNWLSREYVIVNYTKYFFGPSVRPSPPYSQPSPPPEPFASLVKPDDHLLSLSAMLAF